MTSDAASSTSNLIKEEVNGEVKVVNGEVKEENEFLVKNGNPENPAMSENVKSEVSEPKMWGVCLADMDNCTVHSTILPKTHWSYIGKVV